MSKEVTLFVLDVSQSMGERRYARDWTDLEWALEYIYARIGPKIISGRKTDLVGIVGFNTDNTDNTAATMSEDYRHIQVIVPILQFLMPQVRLLQGLGPSSVNGVAQVIEALAVATDMIDTHCRKLQYIKNIVLITNGQGPCDTYYQEGVEQKIKESNINVMVIGMDFDDPGYGFKEEEKSEAKRRTEHVLAKFCNKVDGLFATMAEAYEQGQMPRVKPVQSVNTFKDGTLTLGDPRRPEEFISIGIERFSRTKSAKSMGATKFSALADQMKEPSSFSTPFRTFPERENSEIEFTREYTIPDENAVDGKRVVDKEGLEKGYLYGSTIIHISEEDIESFTYPTEAGLQILGFLDQDLVARYMIIGETSLIAARKFSETATAAIGSIVNVLAERRQFAVARFVPKQNKEPAMVLLAPEIVGEFRCLLELPVPFAEDLRHYRFAPLDTVKTVKGKSVDAHAYIPTPEMEQAMQEYVHAMDLSTYATRKGQPDEYATTDECYSPAVHRITHAVQHALFHPDGTLPEIPDFLVRFSHPPAPLVAKNETVMKKLAQVLDVKKLPPQKRFKRRTKDGEERVAEPLDVEKLLSPRKKGKKEAASVAVAPGSIVADFKKAWDTAQYTEAAQATANALGTLVKHSLGDLNYSTALEVLRTWRAYALDFDEGIEFNRNLRQFKRNLLAGALGGDRTELWELIKEGKIQPITASEGDHPNLPGTPEAESFLTESQS